MPGQIEILGIGILSWVTWLPAVGVIILLFFNKSKSDSIRWFANAWIVLCFLISIPLLTGFVGRPGYDKALGGLQFIENHEWIPLIGARYQLGVDGLSLVLVMLTTLLGVIGVVCSWSYIREKGREKEYYIMLLLLQSGMIGAFVAADLFLFFIFWEVMLVPMYFLIGIWGGKNRLYSAIKFFLYTLIGSVVMLLAVLKLFFIFPVVAQAQKPAVLATAQQLAKSPVTGQINGPMLNMAEDAINRATSTSLPPGYVRSSFNITGLTAIGPHIKTVFGTGLVIWLFIGFALSFAIKVPMFPFHTWLPDAHYDAPTAGSVILAGVLLKMGTYGFMRFSLPIFPDAATHPTVRKVMVVLAIIGIIYGALVAMAQKDVKKLIAYSSVSHLGFVMLGLFALNPIGINGAVMQMINHGISTGALFMLAGILYERRHTYEIAEFGGLAHVMPVYSTIFLIVTLSSLGLPLMNNFIGEFMTLRGAFEANVWWAGFATSGIILGAAYMLWLYQRVFFGQLTNKLNEKLPDLSTREAWQFAPLIFLIFWIGIYPKPLLDYINPQTETVVAHVVPDYFRTAPAANKPEIAEEKRDGATETAPETAPDSEVTR
ncbi:MAG TPA: NADH-quinone oxidoreductase subunit M [Blastocatellia bacterium]|jgi:NADH-quinone oxidoreductase subunit M|nr:NADH-quinone oxidoreductase subunit M [Blastocatellia bacterium]